jgi:hypothetical protein
MAGEAADGRRGRKAGFRCQGLNQDSGFRSQESEARRQNEEHLLSAFCLLLTADCLLYLGKDEKVTLKKERAMRECL